MKKILIVDNNRAVLSILRTFLSENQYAVKTLSKWTIIKETIVDFAPDLVLLDIDLNGADGSEICNDLKKAKEHCDLPIILLSSFEMPADYVKDSCAQGLLCKPFIEAELLDIMETHLN